MLVISALPGGPGMSMTWPEEGDAWHTHYHSPVPVVVLGDLMTTPGGWMRWFEVSPTHHQRGYHLSMLPGSWHNLVSTCELDWRKEKGRIMYLCMLNSYPDQEKQCFLGE
ncbi:hypothetical protein Bbelb_308540 [Branchiostoma belcheri]|nr:hypothetical protein Bbelb_308540 [Branchiostoma belcheri]